ncbi:DUF3871 family protein [Segetibacter koreensis]|uniref:DUF3871 family protein n=1 Tax=Segetibacter koreensis TaxID=398037 RepID=UPI000374D058|nr:DUF3871 family protein [Segetibacter koreensis]
MELVLADNRTFKTKFIEEVPFLPDYEIAVSTAKPFIEANTIETSLKDIQEQHIIPVYVKDNEPVISHAEFIEATHRTLLNVYAGQTFCKPNIRVSHPIKGRVPEARNKPANELNEHEKTIYYERMAFVIEIPSISQEIDGNTLHLVAGGVKSYNLDNLYAKKGALESFKVFIGFQNRVCTNLCVWTDGYMGDLKVNSLGQLTASIKSLFESYNGNLHLHQLQQFSNYSLTEQQFAHLIGRCRMYPHLPKNLQSHISPLLFGDTQLGMVCKDYYKDNSFCRDADGNINLWRLYNLFTGANKTSYIDTFLDRSVNAFTFVNEIRRGLEHRQSNWFLS